MSMTETQTQNAAWLQRATVLAGSSLAGYRLPPEVDFVVDAAEGSRIRDVDGREYLDFLLGSGPLILGHAHPAVTAAVAAQLPLGSTYYALNRPAIELAEAIVAASPCAERLRFVSTGSEATAAAIRLARGFTGRSTLLKFEGGYHGTHDSALTSFAPSSPEPWPRAVPDSAGIPEGVLGDVRIAPYNDANATAEIAAGCDQELAAILVEPQQRGIPPQPGFLAALRRIANETGAVLIFDEVVTGFRLARGGAQEFCGVVPDLAAYGKIIGGGFPLAAVAGRADILDLSDTARRGTSRYVHLSGTLNGNPVAAVAGLATLAELAKPGVYDRLHVVGQRLRTGLAAVAARRGVPLTVIGEGPLAAVHFTDGPVRNYRDVLGADKKLLARVNAGLLAAGVLAQLSTKLYVSAVHTDDDIDRCIDAFDTALQEARH
jgi:glutamate-1-semialdehyde 2,1-aminomutase